VTNAALDIVRRRTPLADPASEPSTAEETAQADMRMDTQKYWSRLSRDHQAAHARLPDSRGCRDP
jgi:hypothetical protein